MPEPRVSTRTATRRRKSTKGEWLWRRKWWLLIGLLVMVAAGVSTWRLTSIEPGPTEAPEAAEVLAAQESLGQFGILIPAYLPKGFDRAGVQIEVNSSGPAGEPAVDMVYRKKDGSAVFLRQWVPANADLETLFGSRLIQTAWGKSWLLTQSDTLICVWVDVGPLRVSLSTNDPNAISREQLVLAAETLGLASNQQVYSFVTELPTIKDIVPPPPVEVKPNDQGIQELNLTITPGGYSPMRFAVQKGIPVKINFRALGEVGCGNTLIFPTAPDQYAALHLSKEQPSQTVEFTPQSAGEFAFHCTTNCYRGVMTVREQGSQ